MDTGTGDGNCRSFDRPNLLSGDQMCATDVLTGSYNWFCRHSS